MKTLEMLLVTNQQIDFSQFNNWKITLVDNIETAIEKFRALISISLLWKTILTKIQFLNYRK